jgi:hypothetical protein
MLLQVLPDSKKVGDTFFVVGSPSELLLSVSYPQNPWSFLLFQTADVEGRVAQAQPRYRYQTMHTRPSIAIGLFDQCLTLA